MPKCNKNYIPTEEGKCEKCPEFQTAKIDVVYSKSDPKKIEKVAGKCTKPKCSIR